MSEELFIRGIVSLIVGITVFLMIDYRYDEEMKQKTDENKHQRYVPYISVGFLIGGLLGKVILRLLSGGNGTAIHLLISLCFELFLHISLYYMVLLLVLPIFRKRINARICATMWMVPNFLYVLLNGTSPLRKPIGIIAIPKNFVEVIFYIWLIGFCVVLLRGLMEHWTFRSEILKGTKKVEDEAILELWNNELKCANMRYTKYPLLISKKIKTPLSIGMNPSAICVLLPEKEYSLEELKLIFRHEIIHIGREDAWNKFTILFCTAMCWFNPLMWIAMRKSAEDLELSCDETVLLGMNEKSKRQYAELLLSTVGDERGFTTCLSSSAKALKYRLENIIKPNRKNPGTFTLAVVLFVLCMSFGHISLAYGEYSGKEIVYREKNTKFYELGSMYLLEEDTNTTIVECRDIEGFHKYIAGLKLQKMTGNYSFDYIGKKLKFIYESADGSRYVELTDDTIRILALDEDAKDWNSYHLMENVDWEYLETMIFPVLDSD